MAKIKNTTATTLELICTEFMDWFFLEYDPDYERIAPDFNFNCFMSRSERISAATNLEDKCNSSANKYFIYGALCEQYERIATWTITEYKGRGQYKRISYSYKYEACVEYFDGTLVKFVFRTDNRYSEFEDYEQLEKNMIAEKIKHLNDRTVLCLEDKSILFSKACELIHEAIERGYYCGYDKDIDLDEFINLDEIVEEWMQYKNPFSTEYLLNQVQSPVGNLVGQATDEALNWFINGFKNGLLYRLY